VREVLPEQCVRVEVPGGFVVHFFERGLVEVLAAGYKLCSVEAFEEGELPRRLWLIIQRKEHEDGNSDGKFGGVQAGQERP
jgi:hypothetical protein